MSDTVVLTEEIRLRGAKEATSGLDAFSRAASRVSEKLAGIGALAGVLTGLGGAFAVVESVRGVDELYRAIARVKAMTGLTASDTHAMFKMFKLSGVEMEGAERIMISMSRLAGKLGEGVAESAEQAQHLQRIMTRIGVSVKAGPVDRLMQMSKAAKSGKLDINDMMLAFTIPKSQAARFFAMLKQGPEKLREIQKKTLGSASLIDEAALASYSKMLQSRRELKESWDDLVGTLYKGLVPAITKVLQKVQHGFEAIEPTVKRIGEMLSKHGDSLIRIVKSFMMLRTGLSVFNLFRAAGSDKLGMGGLFRKASGFLAAKGAASGSMDYFAARAAGPAGAGMFSSSGGILSKILGSGIGRFAIIGSVILVVVKAFEMISNNVGGIRDTFKSMGSAIMGVFDRLRPVFSAVWGILGSIANELAGRLVDALNNIAKAIEVVAQFANFLIDLTTGKEKGGYFGDFVRGATGMQMMPALEKAYGSERDRLARLEAAKAAKKDTDKNPNPGTNMDFRGSKFEITQNFAEGFDPNRVAVTFQSELIKSGEKRVDSNLRGLWSYR